MIDFVFGVSCRKAGLASLAIYSSTSRTGLPSQSQNRVLINEFNASSTGILCRNCQNQEPIIMIVHLRDGINSTHEDYWWAESRIFLLIVFEVGNNMDSNLCYSKLTNVMDSFDCVFLVPETKWLEIIHEAEICIKSHPPTQFLKANRQLNMKSSSCP